MFRSIGRLRLASGKWVDPCPFVALAMWAHRRWPASMHRSLTALAPCGVQLLVYTSSHSALIYPTAPLVGTLSSAAPTAPGHTTQLQPAPTTYLPAQPQHIGLCYTTPSTLASVIDTLGGAGTLTLDYLPFLPLW